MALSLPSSIRPLTRRGLLKAGLCGAAGLALYSGEIGRHWIEVTEHEVHLRGLSAAFDGMRIAQLSDIHLDNFTEPFFLRHVVERINRIKPDVVFLTGDFVTARFHAKSASTKFARDAAWQCAGILGGLESKALYAVLGNHDIGVGAEEISAALGANGITVLRNACLPIERSSARIWIAGVDDHSTVIQTRSGLSPNRSAIKPMNPSSC